MSVGESTEVVLSDSQEGAAEDRHRRVVEASCQLWFADSIRDLEFWTNECAAGRMRSEAREVETIRRRFGDLAAALATARVSEKQRTWMYNTPPWRIVLRVRVFPHKMLVDIPLASRLNCLMDRVTAVSGLERSSVHFELVTKRGLVTSVVLSGEETAEDLDLVMEDQIEVYKTAAASLESPELRGRSRSPRLRARDRQALDDMSRPRASSVGSWREIPWIDITDLD